MPLGLWGQQILVDTEMVENAFHCLSNIHGIFSDLSVACDCRNVFDFGNSFGAISDVVGAGGFGVGLGHFGGNDLAAAVADAAAASRRVEDGALDVEERVVMRRVVNAHKRSF